MTDHQAKTHNELSSMSMDEYAALRQQLMPSRDGVVTVEPRPPDPLDVAIADPMVSILDVIRLAEDRAVRSSDS